MGCSPLGPTHVVQRHANQVACEAAHLSDHEGVKGMKRAEGKHFGSFWTVEGRLKNHEAERRQCAGQPFFMASVLLRPSKRRRALFFSSLHALHAFM
jgi:hypothetical protein